MDKIHCSVPILTLNRAKELERCLESVKDFSDIIILDGGSADDTLEIARKYGARIYFQNGNTKEPVRIADFTAMRIKAWSYAKEDWIFHIDSNEWLNEKLIEEVKNAVIENNYKKVYFAKRINVIDGKIIKYAFFYPKFYPRLVNVKNGVRWQEGRKVHEKLEIPPEVVSVYLDGLVYKASVSGKEAFVKKKNYYIDLELKKRTPGQKTWHQFFYWVLYRNFRTIFGAIFKSILIYLRYGFKESLPPKEVWFNINYHLTLMFREARIIFKNKLSKL